MIKQYFVDCNTDTGYEWVNTLLSPEAFLSCCMEAYNRTNPDYELAFEKVYINEFSDFAFFIIGAHGQSKAVA